MRLCSDFANGFLIAHIFSSYFPEQFTMHSFDPGSSMEKKKNNWKQLCMLFKKIKFSIRNEMAVVRSIIDCDMDTTIVFINEVYTFLTTKSTSRKCVPQFSRRPLPVSASSTEQKNDIVESEHLDSSSSINSSKPSKLLRGKLHQMDPRAESKLSIQTGGVNIKPVKETFMSLRTSKLGLSSSLPGTPQTPEEKQYCMDGHTPMHVLEQIILEHLSQQPNSLQLFLSSSMDQDSNGDDHDLHKVLGELALRAIDFAAVGHLHLHELIKIIPLLCSSFIVKDSNDAGRVLVQVGRSLNSNKPNVTSSFFFDFMFPALKPAFIGDVVSKRRLALAIMESYCPFDSNLVHTCCIREFTSRVDEISVTLACVVDLLALLDDRSLGDIEEPLKHLYLELGFRGISTCSPSIRTNGAYILMRVTVDCVERRNISKVDLQHLLQRLLPLCKDTWWEVVCLALQTYCFVLQTGVFETALEAIETILLSQKSPMVCQQLCLCVAPLLKQFPQLTCLFLGAVLELQQPVRKSLLGLPCDPLPMMRDSVAKMAVNTTLMELWVWDTPSLVEDMIHRFGSKQALDAGQIDLLFVLVNDDSTRDCICEIWSHISTPLMRSLEIAVSRSDMALEIVDLLKCFVVDNNVFSHPLWSIGLHALFIRSTTNDFHAAPAYLFAQGIRSIVDGGDQECRALFYAMVEQTSRDFPELVENRFYQMII